jgi:D-alanyl-D-alanine carboxypeptidase
MRAWLIAGVLLVTAGAAVLIGRAAFSSSPQPWRPELQRVLDGLVTGRGRIAPGVTAYVSGPHGTWLGSAGLADVATGEPMRPNARVRLGSVSKLWTATVIMQLVGEGKLKLDDSVEHWLPGLPAYASHITVRDLLNHTSEMVDTNDITQNPVRYLRRVKDPALRGRLETVARRLAQDPGYAFPPGLWIEFAAALPLLSVPGTSYHYSNIGYMVAGRIAERAGGGDLATLVRRGLTEPLHLTDTAYDPAPQISGSHAHGYSVASTGKLIDTITWTEGLGANGGVVSNAADEAHFLQALKSGKVLAPAQLAAVKQPSAFSNYGLGTGVDQSGCAGTAYGHNGAGAGFETNVFVSSDGSRVAVLLLNGRTADSHGDATAFNAMQRLYCAA